MTERPRHSARIPLGGGAEPTDRPALHAGADGCPSISEQPCRDVRRVRPACPSWSSAALLWYSQLRLPRYRHPERLTPPQRRMSSRYRRLDYRDEPCPIKWNRALANSMLGHTIAFLFG